MVNVLRICGLLLAGYLWVDSFLQGLRCSFVNGHLNNSFKKLFFSLRCLTMTGTLTLSVLSDFGEWTRAEMM